MASMAENLRRRQFSRAAVALPAQFRVESDNASNVSHEGEVVDLGEGGMRLVSRSHAPARSTIRITFHVPGNARDIRARGRVVLSFYSAPEDKYHHGVAFTSIDRDDRELIASFVESQTANQA